MTDETPMTAEQATQIMDDYQRALTLPHGGGHPALDRSNLFQADEVMKIVQARRIIANQPPEPTAAPATQRRRTALTGAALAADGAVDLVTRRQFDQRHDDLRFALTGSAPGGDKIDAQADSFIRQVMSPSNMAEEAIAYRDPSHPRH